jgi:hypothetical protein
MNVLDEKYCNIYKGILNNYVTQTHKDLEYSRKIIYKIKMKINSIWKIYKNNFPEWNSYRKRNFVFRLFEWVIQCQWERLRANIRYYFGKPTKDDWVYYLYGKSKKTRISKIWLFITDEEQSQLEARGFKFNEDKNLIK